MKEIRFTMTQMTVFRLIGSLFVFSLLVGLIGRIFFPLHPTDIVTPGDPTMHINYFLGTIYGIQFGLIIFGGIGILFYLSFYFLVWLVKGFTIQLIEPEKEGYNSHWKKTWIGLLLVLWGISIAFIPLFVESEDIILFPTLVLGTIIGAFGALLGTNGLRRSSIEPNTNSNSSS